MITTQPQILVMVLANNPPDPTVIAQWGPLGGLVFVIVTFVTAIKYLLDRQEKQIQVVADGHKAAFSEMAREVKEGFAEVKAGFAQVSNALEKRDAVHQVLFDKHLSVTVEVTKGVSQLAGEVAINSRQINEAKNKLDAVSHQLSELERKIDSNRSNRPA